MEAEETVKTSEADSEERKETDRQTSGKATDGVKERHAPVGQEVLP